MLKPQLVDMLCCPATRQDLVLADEAQVDRLNEAIRSGGLQDVGGETVDFPVNGALIRVDREVVYLVRQDIPVMLADRAVRYEDTLGEQRYQPATTQASE